MTDVERQAAAKPTAESLGIDLAAQHWRRSGSGPGAIEVALVTGPCAGSPRSTGSGGTAIEWVLMRVAGDVQGRVLVYDPHEWECFLDGVRNGEFDSGAG